jgi:Zn-dependent M28 family amino/carboxypeptidase
MYCAKALVITLLAVPVVAADFSGASALEFTRKVVALGPRPPGSPAIRKLQAFIEADARQRRCEVIEDSFRAVTPAGPIQMKNIVCKFPGTSGRAIVLTGHYDSKLFPGRHFVGANDSGSSTGILLEFARVLAGRSHPDDIYLVWFDGEEAIAEWTATDSLYGSRHLAERWANDGTLSRIKALVNLDMIGDRDLGIMQNTEGSPQLNQLIWTIAKDLGYGKYFLNTGGAVEDDHVPFLRRGVNAVDLIDFDYGPQNSYWHTDQDTMDKLSAHSFQVVGDIMMELIRRLST